MGGPAFQLTVTRSTIDGRSRAGSIRRNVQTSPTHSITREVIALGLTKTTIGEQTSYLLQAVGSREEHHHYGEARHPDVA